MKTFKGKGPKKWFGCWIFHLSDGFFAVLPKDVFSHKLASSWNDEKKPLQQSKSKVTSSFLRLIDSIDYALIIEGGERNEPIIRKETLIKLDVNKWKEVIWEEYTSLKKNKTWVLTNFPTRFLVGCKWVFKVKLKSISCIDHYKTPFVTKGYSQVAGIDYQDCFSLVVKITSIRVLMAIVVEKNLELHYMDVKIVFQNGFLEEDIYMQ